MKLPRCGGTPPKTAVQAPAPQHDDRDHITGCWHPLRKTIEAVSAQTCQGPCWPSSVFAESRLDVDWHSAELLADGQTIWDNGELLNTRTNERRRLSLEKTDAVSEWPAFTPDVKTVLAPVEVRPESSSPPLFARSRQWSAVGVWDIATGRQLARIPVHVTRPPCITPDGNRLVTVDEGRLAVWDVATGKPIRTYPVPPLDGQWLSLTLSPDGKTAATGHELGTVLLWDVSER